MKSNSDDSQSLADREFLAAFSETVKNGEVIDWRYWIKDMQKLNAAEAARLMCGLDPDVIKNLDFQSEGVKDKENDSRRACRKAAMIQRLAERHGKELARPDEWITWADEHQIAVHDGFRLEVESAPATDNAKPAPDELDYSLLATPEYLIDAYGKWGLKIEWFKDLNSHKWLRDARRKKGQGQRGQVIEPLFCPYAVMNGFIENVRKEKRVPPAIAWRTLEHKFPRVYAAFEQYDPRERTGE